MSATFDHVHLRSLDPDAAAAFYVDVLGGVHVARAETGGQLRVSVAFGGVPLFIDRVPADTATLPPPPFVGIEHLGFRVEAIDAFVAGLAAQGVEVVVAPHDVRPGLRIAFIRGPDDVRIELLQRG